MSSLPDPNRLGAQDGFGFEIKGAEMQFVEIELHPGAAVVAEAGAIMFKHPAVQMETVFGYAASPLEGGVFGRVRQAGRQWLAGERLFTTVFTHVGAGGPARVAFAAPYPGKIIPVRLREGGGVLICQKGALLAASRGLSVGVHLQRRILTGLFGGEGFVMQRLTGDGLAFIHAGGTVEAVDLAEGEELHVNTGCLVAMTGAVAFDVERVRGVQSTLFGGEGFFLARVAGPGRVWVQSLPFRRLARRIAAGAGGRRGEGGGASVDSDGGDGGGGGDGGD